MGTSPGSGGNALRGVAVVALAVAPVGVVELAVATVLVVVLAADPALRQPGVGWVVAPAKPSCTYYPE